MSKHKNVFISHHSKDEEHIGKLQNLLSKNGFVTRNSSMDTSKRRPYRVEPETIKRLLRMRMKWSSTCIVLIGKKTHSREFVDWEIKNASRQGKRIVGIYLHGEKETAKVPDALNKFGDSLISWRDSQTMIDVIDGRTNKWVNSNGSNRDPFWDGTQSNC